ncbi:Tn3 family transposase [Streptomyces prasinus]
MPPPYGRTAPAHPPLRPEPPPVFGPSTPAAVASDSTHVRAYDQNLFTEWHSRYGGRGVLIYWHVEKKSLALHSQLINCTASEVAAMIEGAMRHGTTMEVEANCTDSHGQSEIGFGVTRLLNFDDIPGDPEWADLLTPADRRGLTPLFWSHVRPHGEVNLDMDTRLDLTAATVPGPRAADGKAVRSTVEKT